MKHLVVVAKEVQYARLVKAFHNNRTRHAPPLRIHLNAKENEFKNLGFVLGFTHVTWPTTKRFRTPRERAILYHNILFIGKPFYNGFVGCVPTGSAAGSGAAERRSERADTAYSPRFRGEEPSAAASRIAAIFHISAGIWTMRSARASSSGLP